MSPRAGGAHRWVLISHGLLVALVFIWQLTLRPAPASIGFALLAVSVLLPPWPGLVQGKRYTHAWSTLCVMPYLVLGSVESVANPGERLWSGTCVLLALLFFAALIHYLRVTRPAADV